MQYEAKVITQIILHQRGGDIDHDYEAGDRGLDEGLRAEVNEARLSEEENAPLFKEYREYLVANVIDARDGLKVAREARPVGRSALRPLGAVTGVVARFPSLLNVIW